MAFRELHMVEIKEVLRLWSRGHGLRTVALRTGVDRKTVRRYVEAARKAGLKPDAKAIEDGLIAEVEAHSPKLVVTGNQAVGEGGGIRLGGGCVISGATVEGNTAAQGGGIRMGTESSASHVRLVGNEATVSGGGVFVQNSASLSYAVVLANTAPDGAGAYLSSFSGSVEHSVFGGNEATLAWGGAGLRLNVSTFPSLTNLVIAFNSTGWAGAGVGVNDGSQGVFVSCNVWGNSPADWQFHPVVVGQSGNVAVSPGFLGSLATDPSFWNVRLMVASPMIDAGDPTVLDPDGSPSDMGAFGGPGADQWDLDGDGFPSWWQPGPYDYGSYPALGWDCDDLDASVFPGTGC